MRKLLLASIAASAVITSLVAPVASAAPLPSGPSGARCGYDANSDPSPDAGPDDMIGEIDGGPLAWDRPFTLHCVIQVNNPLHSDPDTLAKNDAAAVGSGTAWVAVAPPKQVAYQSGEFDQDYLCTEVVYAGGTLYWSAASDPDGLPNTGDEVPGFWTTNASAPCNPATQTSTGPVVRLLEQLEITYVDPTLCAVLKQLHAVTPAPVGPLYIDTEGDVFLDLNLNGITESDWQNDLFWDCPLYTAYPLPGADGAAGGVVDF